MSSFLNSLLNVFTSFTMSVVNGFVTIPITQIRKGAFFTDMQNAVNFVNQAGKFQIGQPYGSSSSLSQPHFQEAPDYRPGETTPPRTFPTSQAGGYEVPLGLNPASMYKASAEAVRVIKMFEGLHQRPVMIDGKKYIGYGHQLSDKDTKDYVSMDEAVAMLNADISAAENMVKGAISGQIHQGHFDALVDFAFTMAGSNFKGSSVLSKFNSGDIAGACTELGQSCYVNQHGTVAKNLHLTARRMHNVKWMTMPIDPLSTSTTP